MTHPAPCRLSATPWAVTVGRGGKVLARFARRMDAVTYRKDEPPAWTPQLVVVREPGVNRKPLTPGVPGEKGQQK